MEVRLSEEDEWRGRGWIAFEREEFEVDTRVFQVVGSFVYEETGMDEEALPTDCEVSLVIDDVYEWEGEECRKLPPEEALAFAVEHAEDLAELHDDEMASAAEARFEG